jgi:hypothetical protein
MSYQSLETSIQDSEPIELYTFIIGATFYRYASGQLDITAITESGASHDYTAIPISRTEPEQTKELARQNITVTVRRDCDVANKFVSFLPSDAITLNIWRMQPANNPVLYFTGTVKSLTWKDGTEAELLIAPVLSLLKRAGLTACYGATCQNALYDGDGGGTGRCSVVRDDYKTTDTLTDVGEDATGFYLEASTLGAAGDATDTWFPAGYAERTNGDKRFIIGQSGNKVYLLLPFPSDLDAGDSVDFFAGCAHDIDTCFSKFNTTENPDAADFFGFHVNPRRNPFTQGLK